MIALSHAAPFLIMFAAVLCYLNARREIRRRRIVSGLTVSIGRNGRCVRTTQPIPTGVKMLNITGERCTRENLPQPYVRDEYLQIGPDAYIRPDSPLLYLNHSCQPNCKIAIESEIELISRRSIRAGEELTFDYSCTIENDDWQMNCNCGEPNCRRIICEDQRK